MAAACATCNFVVVRYRRAGSIDDLFTTVLSARHDLQSEPDVLATARGSFQHEPINDDIVFSDTAFHTHATTTVNGDHRFPLPERMQLLHSLFGCRHGQQLLVQARTYAHGPPVTRHLTAQLSLSAADDLVIPEAEADLVARDVARRRPNIWRRVCLVASIGTAADQLRLKLFCHADVRYRREIPLGYHDNNERDEWIDVQALRILITRATIPMLPPAVPHAVLHGAAFSNDVAGDGPSEQALANALRQLRDGTAPLSREAALNQVQRLVGFQPKHVSHQAVDAVCQRLLSGAELATSPPPPPPHVNRSSFYNWHARIVDTPAVQASLALLDLSERPSPRK